MPFCFIEGPEGIRDDAKRTMVKGVSAALDAVYQLPDTRVFVRQHSDGDVGQDGELAAGVRPVAFLEGPAISVDAKRRLVREVTAAVAEGYGALTDPASIMVLVNEYPLENAGLNGVLTAEIPGIHEAAENRAATT